MAIKGYEFILFFVNQYYSFSNLCSWTSEHEITAPFSPAYVIKPIREIMKGKFGGLARIYFGGVHEGAYQEVDGNPYGNPSTGYDTLLYKAIYTNAISILFLVDRETGIEAIAEMTRFNGEQSKVTIIDPERDKKYFQTLTEEEFYVMFERASGFIKINQKDESSKPTVAVSL
jgi:hypothetical protein